MFRLPTHPPSWATVACASLVLAACTTIGEGTGSMPGGAPVDFDWASKDGGMTGTMTAMLPDGTVFSGPFVQITSIVRIETLDPIWRGWPRGWSDWRYWGPFPETAFVTRYSGRVVANLSGPADRRLRCRFHLNAPEAGMRGGGQGECQGNDGRLIDAVFTRPSRS